VRRCGRSIHGPIVARITGSSVIETSTLTTGISIPAYPIERRKGIGSTTSESRPIPTVVPEKTIASPAVAIAFSTACTLSAPCSRSSRQRITSNSV